MTTLAILKAEIADDLDRTDLTTQIASEIDRAIIFYQNKRFFFNETRAETFSTVAAQALYTSSDDAVIPTFIEFDDIYLETASEKYTLCQIAPVEWEIGTGPGAASGMPFAWSYFNQSIGLYPIPGDIYTIRMTGLIKKDAPASDAEANNVWMVEGYNLIRSRVCAQLSLRKLKDSTGFQANAALERQEFDRLKSETASRTGTGYVTPTQF